MNKELIDRLIREATIQVHAEREWDVYESYFHKEKFAELIIKECADYVHTLGAWCGGHGEPRAPRPEECSVYLKKHFGIE